MLSFIEKQFIASVESGYRDERYSIGWLFVVIVLNIC